MNTPAFSIEGEGDETNAFPTQRQPHAVVFGAGGFIGSHLVTDLKKRGYYVTGVDLKFPEFGGTDADVFVQADLRDPRTVENTIPFNCAELYQLAADMGGAGYIFTGDHDADVMHNSALININTVKECVKKKVQKVFYSSSACVYPARNQTDPNNPNCVEVSAYPAEPDSEYGWEKLFSERLYLSFARNYGLNVRIARFHNIFGPHGTFSGGREKAPAALCRKVAEADSGDTIEIWGPGTQTRSFLFISECIEGINKIMHSNNLFPVNLGSEEMISINDLAKMIIQISGKEINIMNIPGPVGVAGRNSENTLLQISTGWEPFQPLFIGIKQTYYWIESYVKGMPK